MLTIVKTLNNVLEAHLLPFHRLGEAKYERMESSHKPPVIEPPGQETMEKHKTIFEGHGLTVRIGG